MLKYSVREVTVSYAKRQNWQLYTVDEMLRVLDAWWKCQLNKAATETSSKFNQFRYNRCQEQQQQQFQEQASTELNDDNDDETETSNDAQRSIRELQSITTFAVLTNYAYSANKIPDRLQNPLEYLEDRKIICLNGFAEFTKDSVEQIRRLLLTDQKAPLRTLLGLLAGSESVILAKAPQPKNAVGNNEYRKLVTLRMSEAATVSLLLKRIVRLILRVDHSAFAARSLQSCLTKPSKPVPLKNSNTGSISGGNIAESMVLKTLENFMITGDESQLNSLTKHVWSRWREWYNLCLNCILEPLLLVADPAGPLTRAFLEEFPHQEFLNWIGNYLQIREITPTTSWNSRKIITAAIDRATLLRLGVVDPRVLLTVGFRDGSVRQQVQGKDSIIRRKLLSPRSAFLRLQLIVEPGLRNDSVVLPQQYRHYFGRLTHVDRTRPLYRGTIEENEDAAATTRTSEDHYHGPFVDLPRDSAGLLIRHPVIHTCSVIAFVRVAFHDRDVIRVPLAILPNQNGDCDGDAEHCGVNDSYSASYEVRLCLAAENNATIPFNNTRLMFEESHVLCMHKRKFPRGHPYSRVRDVLQKRAIHEWCADSANTTTLDNLIARYPRDFSYDDVDPTRRYLQQVALYVAQVDGSKRCDDFFGEIDRATRALTAGGDRSKKHPFYDASLPNVYEFRVEPMDSSVEAQQQRHRCSLLQVGLKRVAMSGAKGNLAHLKMILDRVEELDNSTKDDATTSEKPVNNGGSLSDVTIAPTDYSRLEKNVEIAMAQMDTAAARVPMAGHDFFKRRIYDDGFNVRDDSCIYYNDTRIAENVPPDTILFPEQIFDASVLYALVQTRIFDDASQRE